MIHRLHTLALAAVLLTAGAAHAQTAAGGATVTTQASGSGTLTQNSDRNEANGRQSLLVAATEAQANLGTSTLTLTGSVATDVLQNRVGGGGAGAGLQRISVGGASGEVQLRSATTEGRLLAPVVQNLQSDSGTQILGVAALHNASGGSVRATGTLTRADLRQDNFGGAQVQKVLVGSADGVNVTDATLNGFLAAQVDQGAQGRNGEQLLSVGSIQSTGGDALSAGGRFFGALSQQQSAGGVGIATQRVEIGSVRGAGGAARIFAAGFADAQLLQALDGSGVQDVSVGSAINRGSGNVFIAGELRGRLDQASNSDGSLQRVDVGSAIGGAGAVQTNAAVDAQISQTAQGAGAGPVRQTVAVGTVNGTLSSAQTLGGLRGQVVQRAEAGADAITQTVAIGSIQGSSGLVARTNADFSGTLAQTATRGAGNQTIAIGSVGR